MANHPLQVQNPEASSKPSSPLGVAELLDKVLGYLPMQDLLASCKVCLQWRDVIRGNRTLRRRLWLADMGWMEADGGFRREDGIWVKYLVGIGFVEVSLEVRKGYGGVQ